MINPRTIEARTRVRKLMPLEGDLCFRRRCETILEFLDPKADETVLDCGCGYGFTLRMLAELTSAKLLGLDLGHDRLVETQSRLNRRPRLVRGSATSLPLPDGSIAKAVSSEVFEHLPDDAAAARELFRVLEPGGSLVVTVPSSTYPFGWDPLNWTLERTIGRKIDGEHMWSGIWYGHLRLYSIAQLTNVLKSAGFEIVETRALTHYVPLFNHLLIYGILKPLLLSGKLPTALRRAGDRHAVGNEPAGATRIAAKLLNRLDALNDDPTLPDRVSSFVALAALARKPRY